MSSDAGALAPNYPGGARAVAVVERLRNGLDHATALRRHSATLCQGATAAQLESRPRSHYSRVGGWLSGLSVAGLVRRDGSFDGDRALVARARHRDGLPSALRDSGPIDPLAQTLRLARACNPVIAVEFFDAGRRSVWALPGVPPFSMRLGAEPPGGVSITVAEEGDVHVVHLAGELDMAEQPRVRHALVDVAGSTVVVDLAGLSFIDASGLSALLDAKAQIEADGHTFVVRGANGIVRRVFEITGLSDLLDP